MTPWPPSGLGIAAIWLLGLVPASQAEVNGSVADPSLESAALKPREVLGNLACTMMAGRGASSGTAVVVVASATDARFSVVDGGGSLVADTLPFRPHHFRLGRQQDGTPVVGFGDLRSNSKQFRPVASPEPVRVYVGEQVAYDSDKAWDFLVAHDGSSFAVHEPLAGGASRLVVHDLELGTERNFDLGKRMTPVNAYERDHMIYYTLDAREIMFQSARGDAMGIGTYWFFPVNEGPVQRVAVEDDFGAVLISRREGYFAHRREDRLPDGAWGITRRTFDATNATTDVAWSRMLDLEEFSGRMSLSDNGRWLGVHGWDFHVLDTQSGDTVFRYRIVGYPPQHLPRLVSVVGEDASAADVGRLGSITFQGDNMLFFRQFGQYYCSTPPGEEYDDLRYRKCVRRHRKTGRYRAVYDVYDMKTISLDAQPTYRAEVYRETNCMEGNMPFRGLQSVGGELTYLSEPPVTKPALRSTLPHGGKVLPHLRAPGRL